MTPDQARKVRKPWYRLYFKANKEHLVYVRPSDGKVFPVNATRVLSTELRKILVSQFGVDEAFVGNFLPAPCGERMIFHPFLSSDEYEFIHVHAEDLELFLHIIESKKLNHPGIEYVGMAIDYHDRYGYETP